MERLLEFTDNRKMRLGKIVGIAVNYRLHATELSSKLPQAPVFFLKPQTSMIPDGGEILLPPQSQNVHEEVELAVIMGSGGRDIPAAKALDCVAGYAVILDITARDLQQKAKADGRPWSICKGFDTFAPVSKVIPAAEISNPQDVRLKLSINSEVRQDGSTANMIFPVRELIHHVSKVMTLEEGDMIATGTPEGVSQIKDGDVIESELIGHIKMKNSVRKG